MVTVEYAIRLWDSVDQSKNATEAGAEFRRLLSLAAPTAKIPKKSSRLRTKILVASGAVERLQSSKDGDSAYLQSWFIKPKKHASSITSSSDVLISDTRSDVTKKHCAG